jgi:hypothetical protein
MLFFLSKNNAKNTGNRRETHNTNGKQHTDHFTQFTVTIHHLPLNPKKKNKHHTLLKKHLKLYKHTTHLLFFKQTNTVSKAFKPSNQ